MSTIVFLVERLAIGLYIFVGLGIFWYWRKYLMARRYIRSTHYELERDLKRYEGANALTLIVLLIEFGLVIVGVQQVVAPTVRQQQVAARSGDEAMFVDAPFATLTPAPTVALVIDTSGVELEPTNPADAIQVTPVPTATPVGTIDPNAPAAVGCETDYAQLQVPANGMRVFNIVEVLGKAYTDDFAMYKLELRGGPYTNWHTLVTQNQPLDEIGALGQFNPAPYEPGLYQFRLVVFDATTAMKASCTVAITISGAPPTPTPLGE